MGKKIATFKDLDDLAGLISGITAGYITGALDNQCVTKGNFNTVSTNTLSAQGNGLMFSENSESSNYASNRLILLEDVQYVSEITAVLVSAPNIPASGGTSYATWELTQYYKKYGDTAESSIVWTVQGSDVSADSRGTTAGEEKNIISSKASVERNGKSITLSQMIKQDLNKIESVGDWSKPNVTLSQTTFGATGGALDIIIEGECKRVNTWSSGETTTDKADEHITLPNFVGVSLEGGSYFVGLNTTGSERTGNIVVYWGFDSSSVYNVSFKITQSAQGQCSMSLTGSSTTYHNTATIKGSASVDGTIYWGTSEKSMTNAKSVSANSDVVITSRTTLGKTTVYAYFVPTDSAYVSLGSSTMYHATASAEILQATDASVNLTTYNNLTYTGSAQTIVECSQAHGVSTWTLGYTTSSSSTSPTWITAKTNLSLTNAGTYYIWAKWTADSNHSNSNSGSKTGDEITINGASFTVNAPNQTFTYTGSAQGNAITVSGLKGSQTATIKYGTTSGSYTTTTVPTITNANEDKTIYWQVTAPNHTTQTGSYTITMNQANGSGSVTMNGWIYGNSVTNPSPSSSTNGTSNVSYTWYNSSKTKLGAKPTSTSNVGTYYVKATFAATTNYKAYTTDYVSFAISNATITVIEPDQSFVYTGSAQGNVITATTKGNQTATIKYGTTSGSYNLTSAPTRTTVGSDTIYWQVTAPNHTNATGSYTLTITNASFTVNAPNQTFTYTGSAQGNAITVSGLKGSQTATIKYGTTSGSYTTTTAPTRTNSGSTTVYWQVTAPNHETKSGQYTITITAAGEASVTVTPITGITYNGSAQQLTSVSAFGVSTWTLGYTTSSSSTSPTWIAAKTNLSLTNAGTYYIWVKWTADENHSNNETGKNTGESVTIAKATPTMTLTGVSKTYDGNTYYVSGKASVAGTIYYGTTSATSGMTSTKTVTANTSANLTGRANSGTTNVYAYFVPTDTTNYNTLGSSTSAYASAIIAIAKATSTITYAPQNLTVQCLNSSSQLLNATSIEYTKASVTGGSVIYTLNSVTNSGGTSVTGFAISGDNISIPANIAVGDYTVDMTVGQNNSNYLSSDVNKTFIITVQPDVLGSYNGTLTLSSNSVLSAGADERTITWGKVYQTWTHGGEDAYVTGNVTLNVSCGVAAALDYVSIDNASYENNATQTSSIFTKTSYGTTVIGAAVFVITLNAPNGDVVKSVSLVAAKNESTSLGIETSYGTPTITVGEGLGPGITSASITTSANNMKREKFEWTSGSTSYGTVVVQQVTPTLSIDSQTYNKNTTDTSDDVTITRFRLTTTNGNLFLSHGTMSTNEGIDTVVLKATNGAKTTTKSIDVRNARQYTLDSINLTYDTADYTSGSKCTPNVTFNVTYNYLSGSSGASLTNRTSIVGCTFTKTFVQVAANSAATLNTSTGVVTWNSANTSKTNRTMQVSCSAELSSEGTVTSQSCLPVTVTQRGTMSAAYMTTISFVNNMVILPGTSYEVYGNDTAVASVDTITTAGVIATQSYTTTPVTIQIRPTNTSGSSRTLRVQWSGTGSPTIAYSQGGGTMSIPNGISTPNASYYMTVTITPSRATNGQLVINYI